MLAQFGRGGLVQDVASRLIAAFAANLGARLSHSAHGEMSAPPPAVGEFNAGLLVFSVLIDRVKRFVSALLGRKGAEP